MGWFQLVQRSEHLLQSMEEGAAHMAATVGFSLHKPKEVIYKGVHIRQELGVGV